ncbi:AMP-binding protein [Azospirillum sp.]|uniref:AMP-binding protein n=1 Tax=Azospirillum sp. TaxID=34012 RepID=UPI002D4E0B6F|nr:AMP-binding protein [Azospirillum sp.]HYD70518.1 AMP-binding protein [Azospirillum sp.]
MTAFRPDPRFRLVEGGATIPWGHLLALADRLTPELAHAGGRAAVAPGSVATLIGALIAAERCGIEVFPCRPDLEPSAQAVIHPDGAVEGRGTAPLPGFSLLLATSGTTGTPKLARHDLTRLTGRLRRTAPDARWLLTFDPAGFAGLQVILTALLSGATLVALPGADAATLAVGAGAHAVTHASGTPSFWRAFLMAAPAPPPPLASITLGGEAADQATLDRLAAAFPAAKIRHLYASTEAGAAFSVTDGRAGFPAAWLDSGVDGVSLRIRDGLLDIRSPRGMLDYVGGMSKPLAEDGWLATGDRVTVEGDRVLFAGRADGVINVGGVKVAPEVVETALLAVPGVADALVRASPSPVTGHILTAEVALVPGTDEAAVRAALRAALGLLPPAFRPRRIDVVTGIDLSASGKKQRGNAPCAT